jgi:Uma2 family endonuclease
MQVAATKAWTLEELHRLPDDGNRYEVINGELYVTPAPSDRHETIAAKLARVLDRFVEAEALGYVYRPRAVVEVGGSEVEPDLMVRAVHPDPEAGWGMAPRPILVVEILSPTTARRDRTVKRDHYRDIGIAEYWIVDPDASTITVFRGGVQVAVESEELIWAPAEAGSPLRIEVKAIFSRD